MRMKLPDDVAEIIAVLERNGYEAFAVGGCVRDTVLGREPEDWDITTSAKPEEVKRCFPRTIDTGILHGTVTVLRNHAGYEVTTYRIDGEYEDGRHPREVTFTGNLEMDLERRDFTINAMAYNDSVGLVDAFGGMDDLERRVIRCVGDAGQRFDEDALRMLRAVRFSGQLGFSIEENTKEAIVSRAHHLDKISAERIRVEMSKLLLSRGAEQIRMVCETGMAKIFLPELDEIMACPQNNPHHVYSVGEHTILGICFINHFFSLAEGEDMTAWMGYRKQIQEGMAALSEYAREKILSVCRGLSRKEHMILVVAMLFHDIAKPECRTTDETGRDHFHGHPEIGVGKAVGILKRLTFDNETTNTVKHLILYHDYRIEPKAKAVRRATAKVGRNIMWMLFLVQYADALAQNPQMLGPKLFRLEGNMHLYEEIQAAGQALTIRELAVNGSDLMREGVKPGPEMGRILQELLEFVLEDPERNTREQLLKNVQKIQKNID